MTTRQLPNSKLATSELEKYPASIILWLFTFPCSLFIPRFIEITPGFSYSFNQLRIERNFDEGRLLNRKTRQLKLHVFFYKEHVYKELEAENGPKNKELLRNCSG